MNERLKSQASQDIFFIIDEGAKECNKMGIFFMGKKVNISKAILEIKLLFTAHHFNDILYGNGIFLNILKKIQVLQSCKSRPLDYFSSSIFFPSHWNERVCLTFREHIHIKCIAASTKMRISQVIDTHKYYSQS